MFVSRELASPFRSAEEKKRFILKQLPDVSRFLEHRGKRELRVDLNRGTIQLTWCDKELPLSFNTSVGHLAGDFHEDSLSLKDVGLVVVQLEPVVRTDSFEALLRIVEHFQFWRLFFLSAYSSELHSSVRKLATNFERTSVENNLVHGSAVLDEQKGAEAFEYLGLNLDLSDTFDPRRVRTTLNITQFLQQIVVGKRFLEIGSGAGFIPLYLARYAEQTAGIEALHYLHHVSLQNGARNRIRNVSWYHGFSYSADLPERSWDVIFYSLPALMTLCFDSFSHSYLASFFADYRSQSLLSILNESRRYLALGGRIVLGGDSGSLILNNNYLRELFDSHGYLVEFATTMEFLRGTYTASPDKRGDTVLVIRPIDHLV